MHIGPGLSCPVEKDEVFPVLAVAGERAALSRAQSVQPAQRQFIRCKRPCLNTPGAFGGDIRPQDLVEEFRDARHTAAHPLRAPTPGYPEATPDLASAEGCFRVAVEIGDVCEALHGCESQLRRCPAIKLAIDFGVILWTKVGGDVGQVAKVAADDVDGHFLAKVVSSARASFS